MGIYKPQVRKMYTKEAHLEQYNLKKCLKQPFRSKFRILPNIHDRAVCKNMSYYLRRNN